MGNNNTSRARRLRSEMGVSERYVWERLRYEQTGFRWRRQHPFGPYVLDFYCAAALVCLEIDGEQHQFIQERDQVRDEFLASHGVVTVRLPSLDVFNTDRPLFDLALVEVLEKCKQRTANGRRNAPILNPKPSPSDPFGATFPSEEGKA